MHIPRSIVVAVAVVAALAALAASYMVGRGNRPAAVTRIVHAPIVPAPFCGEEMTNAVSAALAADAQLIDLDRVLLARGQPLTQKQVDARNNLVAGIGATATAANTAVSSCRTTPAR